MTSQLLIPICNFQSVNSNLVIVRDALKTRPDPAAAPGSPDPKTSADLNLNHLYHSIVRKTINSESKAQGKR